MKRWPIAALFALTTVTGLTAQIRAGAAKSSITPRSPAWLAGFSGRDHPSQSTAGDIFARALAIDDGSGGRVVILSVELVAVPRVLAERVAADIMKAHGLERGQIVINASGTHNAPFVQGLYPVLSPPGSAEQREIAAYTADVSRALFDVATAALANMQPARLSFSSGHATFAVNAPLRGAAGASNSAGPVDTTVPVLRIATLKGETLAVVFGYACRNATLDAGSYAVSADYSGVAAARIERDFPGSVALFLRSCDGDQSPAPRGSMEIATRHGAALAAEVARVLSQQMPPVTGRVRATLIDTSLPFAPHTREQFETESKSGDPALARRAKLLLAAYDARIEPRQMPYPVQVLRFTKGFTLVALAGEPAVSYALKIRKLLGQEGLMIAGGANDAGYFVPAAGDMESGNADGADSIVDSGLPGAFTDEAEERILNTVERAWKRVGK
jgi:hypothetical protein